LIWKEIPFTAACSPNAIDKSLTSTSGTPSMLRILAQPASRTLSRTLARR
jgi:hypothetical protein